MQQILIRLEHIKNNLKDINSISLQKRNKIIQEIGEKILKNSDIIIQANKKDLAKMDSKDPMYDRLLLDQARIDSMSQSCFDLVKIQDPLEKFNKENHIHTDEGLTIIKTGVPLGVVGCIYESRPNVTIDIAIMCVKSGNAIILRGGNQAFYSNTILISLIQDVFTQNNINKDLIYMYPGERKKLDILYKAVGLVDVIIPRGGIGLIQSVREKSLVPIIETGAGVVHIYLDEYIEEKNFSKVVAIIMNSKVSRPSVCNALDTLIIHRNTPKDLLEKLFQTLNTAQVKMKLLEVQKIEAQNILENNKLVTIGEDDFHTEQLSLGLHIKFVDDISAAIEHISHYSSKHSDAILTDNDNNSALFVKSIDSSVVYVNTSTRFSDGSCFGFGGEIGISTQKLHARGPMGCESLVTYKYVIQSNFNIR